jgi:putative transposase
LLIQPLRKCHSGHTLISVAIVSTESSSNQGTQTHVAYTRRINFRRNWRGYLWQGRFSSCLMDEPHLLAAAAYVERNPVRAGLVRKAEDWRWSSAKTHCEGLADPLVKTDWLTERIAGWVCGWGEYLARSDSPETVSRLRRGESTGRPVGDPTFVANVARRLKRDLTPKTPGRKPKKSKAKK